MQKVAFFNTALPGGNLVPTQVQWSSEKAFQFYSKQHWLIGANYVPANAINQLEMWQAETFDLATIDKELGWAQDLGMNTLRVFLHDLLWVQDAEGFKQRIDQFLGVCERRGIRPMLVLFDSVWNPYPELGPQRHGKQGVHNSGWVQSPGAVILADESKWGILKDYVQDIIGSFRTDSRILAWDLVNEPDNPVIEYQATELAPELKAEQGFKLTRKAFEWGRAVFPEQPMTAGPWRGDWSVKNISKMNRWLAENSDIITFHCYGNAKEFRRCIRLLRRFRRPMICTEYLARANNNTFEAILPIAEKYNVGMMNWGFVSGVSNTIFPWTSWQQPFVAEPEIWHHDILRPDGTPYKQMEVDFLKVMAKKGIKQALHQH